MAESGYSTQTVLVDRRPVFGCYLTPDDPIGDRAGLPLVLLHGLGCSSEVWSLTLRALREAGSERRAIAPDMPGYGRSEAAPRALGIDELADWTVRYLDRLEIPRAHIVAHSMGCQVALAFARRHPHRAGGLILIGPTLGRRVVSPLRYAVGLLADTFLERMMYNGTLAKMMCEMGALRYMATTRKMFDDHPLAYAGEIASPVLVVRGTRDTIVPDASARRLAAALPNGSFTRVSGSAHAVQFNRPRLFTAMACSFLARVDGLQTAATPGWPARVSRACRARSKSG